MFYFLSSYPISELSFKPLYYILTYLKYKELEEEIVLKGYSWIFVVLVCAWGLFLYAGDGHLSGPDEIMARGVMQNFDQMRQENENMVHRYEEVLGRYEKTVSDLEAKIANLEKIVTDFQGWYEKEQERTTKREEQWVNSIEIKGSVNTPNDRYR